MNCMIELERLYMLALNHVPALSPRERFLLYETLGSAVEVMRCPVRKLERIVGKLLKAWLPANYLEQAEADRKYLTDGSIQCTFYWDSSYPPQLREISDPPLVMFYRGKLPSFSHPLVAVVGTRRPAGAARSAAYSLGFELGAMGVGTVSGLARGIDTEAHRGSLDGGGKTYAILGGGVDLIFPSCNAAVGRRILKQGGALMSEFPPGEPPQAQNFPARNRIISGLARTVVLVQAPGRSGALITADYALEQGRDVFVHQVGLAGLIGRGTARLRACGAPVIRGVADVISYWEME